jgi:hypothetical protein
MTRVAQLAWDVVRDGVPSCDAGRTSPVQEGRMERGAVLLEHASPANQTVAGPGGFAGAPYSAG